MGEAYTHVPSRERLLLFIFYFNRLQVINLAQANTLLLHLDYEQLQNAESKIIFGDGDEVNTDDTHDKMVEAEEALEKKAEPNTNLLQDQTHSEKDFPKKQPESGRPTLVIQRSEAEVIEQNNLRTLRQIVKENWIDNYLEHSLHQEAVIWLKLRDYPNLVDRLPYKIIPQGEWDDPLLPDTPIINAFDKVGQRLLILGEPGSGKTILLLELARALLRRADESPGYPNPVVFPLESWGRSKAPLAKWLASELSIHYRIPLRYGRKWIEEDKLFPLLDGLDEVQPADRDACVEAINQFRQEHLVPMAVCSRIADYESLSKQLNLQGAVVLEPLTSSQVNDYLRKAGTALSALKDALVYDFELRELAKSPLMLDVMALAYRDATPTELVKTDTSQTRRQSLFDTYIQRMFWRREAEPIYSPKQTVHLLQWLANSLLRSGQPIFLIERMQPSWLRTSDKKISFLPLTMLLAMPLCGLIFGVFSWLILTVVGVSNIAPLLLFFGLLYVPIMGLIDGVTGRYRSINPIEHTSVLLKRLKSSCYSALFWGVTGALNIWLCNVLSEALLRQWRTTWPAAQLAAVETIATLNAATGTPFSLQRLRIDSRLIFWMDVIAHHVQNPGRFSFKFDSTSGDVELSDFISSGIVGELGGGLLDVVIATFINQLQIFGLQTFEDSRQFVNVIFIVSVAGGLAGMFREIELVRTFGWSWHRIRNNFYSWAIVVLGIGLFFGLLLGLAGATLAQQQNNRFLVFVIINLVIVAVMGLGVGAIGLLIGGFIFQPITNTLITQETRKPNQGIWLSTRNSLLTGLGGALLFGFPVYWYISEGEWKDALTISLSLTPIFGLIGRGDAVAKHCILRIILWLKGYAPWNYSRFLDHATGLIFLRKVGGGYIFVHRMILEHFASLNEQAIDRITIAPTEQKQGG